MIEEESNIFELDNGEKRFTRLRFHERVAHLDLDASYRAEVATPGFLAILSKDNKTQLAPILPSVVKSIVQKISSNDTSLENLEQSFMNLAFIFRFFATNVGSKIEKFCPILLPIMTHRQEYVRSFAGEAIAYIFKRIPTNELIPCLDTFAKCICTVDVPLPESGDENSLLSHKLNLNTAARADALGAAINSILISIDDTFSVLRLPLVMGWALKTETLSFHRGLKAAIFGSLVRMRLHSQCVDGKGGRQILTVLFNEFDASIISSCDKIKQIVRTNKTNESSTELLISEGENMKLELLIDALTMWAIRVPRISGDFDGFVARILRGVVNILDTHLAAPINLGFDFSIIRAAVRSAVSVWRALPQSVSRLLSPNTPREEIYGLLDFPSVPNTSSPSLPTPADFSIAPRVARLPSKCVSCCSNSTMNTLSKNKNSTLIINKNSLSKPNSSFSNETSYLNYQNIQDDHSDGEDETTATLEEESCCACRLGLGAVAVILRPQRISSLTDVDLTCLAELSTAVIFRITNNSNMPTTSTLSKCAELSHLTTSSAVSSSTFNERECSNLALAATSALVEILKEVGADQWLALPELILSQTTDTNAQQKQDSSFPAQPQADSTQSKGRAALTMLLAQQQASINAKTAKSNNKKQMNTQKNNDDVQMDDDTYSYVPDLNSISPVFSKFERSKRLVNGLTSCVKSVLSSSWLECDSDDKIDNRVIIPAAQLLVDLAVSGELENKSGLADVGNVNSWNALCISSIEAFSLLVGNIDTKSEKLLIDMSYELLSRIEKYTSTLENRLGNLINSDSSDSSSIATLVKKFSVPLCRLFAQQILAADEASLTIVKFLNQVATNKYNKQACDEAHEIVKKTFNQTFNTWRKRFSSSAMLSSLTATFTVATKDFEIGLNSLISDQFAIEVIGKSFALTASREASIRVEALHFLKEIALHLTTSNKEIFIDVSPSHASSAPLFSLFEYCLRGSSSIANSVETAIKVRIGRIGPSSKVEGMSVIPVAASVDAEGAEIRDLRVEMFEFAIRVDGTVNALDSERLKSESLRRLGRNIQVRLESIQTQRDEAINHHKNTESKPKASRPSVLNASTQRALEEEEKAKSTPCCSETELPLDVAIGLACIQSQYNEKFAPLWSAATEVLSILLLPNGQEPPTHIASGFKHGGNSQQAGKLATQAKGSRTKKSSQSAASAALLGCGLLHPGLERLSLLLILRIVEFAAVNLHFNDEIKTLSVTELVKLLPKNENNNSNLKMRQSTNSSFIQQHKVSTENRNIKKKKFTRRAATVKSDDVQQHVSSHSAWLARTGGVSDPIVAHASLFGGFWNERCELRSFDVVDTMITHHEVCNIWQILVVAWNSRLSKMKELKSHMIGDGEATVLVKEDPVLQWGIGEIISWATATAEIAANPQRCARANPLNFHRDSVLSLSSESTLSTLSALSRSALTNRLCDFLGVFAAFMSSKRAALSLEVVGYEGRGTAALHMTNRLTEICGSVLISFSSGNLQRTAIKCLQISRFGARVSRFSSILEGLTVDSQVFRDTLKTFTLAIKDDDSNVDEDVDMVEEGQKPDADRTFILAEERGLIVPIFLKMLFARLSFNTSSSAGIAATQRAAVFEAFSSLPVQEMSLLISVLFSSCLVVSNASSSTSLGPFEAERHLMTIVSAAETETSLLIQDRQMNPNSDEESRGERTKALLDESSRSISWHQVDSDMCDETDLSGRFGWTCDEGSKIARLLTVSPSAAAIKSGRSNASQVMREARLTAVLFTLGQMISSFETRIFNSASFIMQVLISVLVESEAVLRACVDSNKHSPHSSEDLDETTNDDSNDTAGGDSNDFSSHGKVGTSIRGTIRMALQRMTDLIKRFPDHPLWPSIFVPAESTIYRLLQNTILAGSLSATATLMQTLAIHPATFQILHVVWPSSLDILFTAGQSMNVIERASTGLPSAGLVELALEVALKLMKGGDVNEQEMRKAIRGSVDVKVLSMRERMRLRKKQENENSDDTDSDAENNDEALQKMGSDNRRADEEASMAQKLTQVALDANSITEMPHRDVLCKDWRYVKNVKVAAELISARKIAGLCALKPRLNILLQSLLILIPKRKGLAAVTSVSAAAALKGGKNGNNVIAALTMAGKKTQRQQAVGKIRADDTGVNTQFAGRAVVTTSELELFSGVVSLATDSDSCSMLSHLLVSSLPVGAAASRLRHESAIRRLRLTVEALKQISAPLALGLKEEMGCELLSKLDTLRDLCDSASAAAATTGKNKRKNRQANRNNQVETHESDDDNSAEEDADDFIANQIEEEMEDGTAKDLPSRALVSIRTSLRALLTSIKDYPARELICEALLATEVSLCGLDKPLGYLSEMQRSSHALEWTKIAQCDPATKFVSTFTEKHVPVAEPELSSSKNKKKPKQNKDQNIILPSQRALWAVAEAHLLISMNVVKPSLQFEPDVDIHADVIASLADLHISDTAAGAKSQRVQITDIDISNNVGSNENKDQQALLLPALQIETVVKQLIFLITTEYTDLAVRRSAIVCLSSVFRRLAQCMDSLDIKALAAVSEGRTDTEENTKEIIPLTNREEFFILKRVVFSTIAMTLRRGLQVSSDDSLKSILQVYSFLIRTFASENRLVKAVRLGKFFNGNATFHDESNLSEASIDILLNSVVVLSDLIHADLFPLLNNAALGNMSADAVGDVGGDLFGELLHLQRHRRGRALAMLTKAAMDKIIRPVTAARFAIPIATWGLLQASVTKELYDISLGERSLETLAACTACCNWKAAVSTARYVAGLIKKFSSREKIIVRAVCAVVAALDVHLKECADAVICAESDAIAFAGLDSKSDGDQDVQAQKEEKIARAISMAVKSAQRDEQILRGHDKYDDYDSGVEDEQEEYNDEQYEVINGNVIAQERKGPVPVAPFKAHVRSGEKVKSSDPADALAQLSAMQSALTSRVLPVLRNLLLDKSKSASATVTAEGGGRAANGSEENGTIRPAVVSVTLRVLRCLPPRRFHVELPRLLGKLIASLKSRDVSQRDAARRAIIDATVALGPAYLPWMVSEISSSLQKGFLQAVLVFTVHAMLQGLSDVTNKPLDSNSTFKRLANIKKKKTKKSKSENNSDSEQEVEEEADRKISAQALQQQQRIAGQSRLAAGSMDAALPHVIPIIVQEMERQLDADRPEIDYTQVGSAKKGIREAKSVKGPMLMRLIAQWASPGSCLTSLLVFLYGLLMGTAYDRDAGGTRALSKAFSNKYLRRVRDIIDAAVIGFSKNDSLGPEESLRLALRLTALSAHLLKKSTTMARHRAARRERFEAAGVRFSTGSYWVTQKDSLEQTGKKGKEGKSLEELEQQEMHFLKNIDENIAVTVTDGPSVTDGTRTAANVVMPGASKILPVHFGGDESSVPRAKGVNSFVNTDKKEADRFRESQQQKSREKKLSSKMDSDDEGANFNINKRQLPKGKGNSGGDDDNKPDLGDDEETIKAAIRLKDQRFMIQPGAANGRRADLAIKHKSQFDPSTRATAVGVGGLKLLLLAIQKHKVVVAVACGLTESAAKGTNVGVEVKRFLKNQETTQAAAKAAEEIDDESTGDDKTSVSSMENGSEEIDSDDIDGVQSDNDTTTTPPHQPTFLAKKNTQNSVLHPETVSNCKVLLEGVIVPVVLCFSSADPELLGSSARCLLQMLSLQLNALDASARDIAFTVLKVFQGAGAASGSVTSYNISKSNPAADTVPTCTRLLAALLTRGSDNNKNVSVNNVAKSCSSWFTQLLATGNEDDNNDEDENGNEGKNNGALAQWKKMKDDKEKSKTRSKDSQNRAAAIAFTQAVVAQIRMSLDSFKLAPSAITLFRRVILAQNRRGDLEEDLDVRSTVYECADKLGELLVTAVNPRVADLAGRAFIEFLLTFPMNAKVQSMRVHHLLRNLAYQEERGRLVVMQSIHRFVKQCPRTIFKESYAPLIVLSIGSRLGSEPLLNARKLASILLTDTLRTIASSGGASSNEDLDSLFSMAYKWVDAEKPSMRAAFAAMSESFVQVWGVEKSLFQSESRTAKLLSAIVKILHSSTVVEQLEDGNTTWASSMNSTSNALQSLHGRCLPYIDSGVYNSGDWRSAYAATLLLERLLLGVDAARLDSLLASSGQKASNDKLTIVAALRTLWAFILSHGVNCNHPWVRTAALRLVTRQIALAANSPNMRCELLNTPLEPRGIPAFNEAPLSFLSEKERERPLGRVVAFACRSLVSDELETHVDSAIGLKNLLIELTRASLSVPSLQDAFFMEQKKNEEEEENIDEDVNMEGGEAAESSASAEDESSSEDDADFMSLDLEENLAKRVRVDESSSSAKKTNDNDDSSLSSDDGIALFVDEEGNAISIDRDSDEELSSAASNDEMSEDEAILALREDRLDAEKAADDAMLAEANNNLSKSDGDDLTVLLQKEEVSLGLRKLEPQTKPHKKRNLAKGSFDLSRAVNAVTGSSSDVTVLFIARKLELHVRRMMRDVAANAVRICATLETLVEIVRILPPVVLAKQFTLKNGESSPLLLKCVIEAAFRAASLRLHERHVAPDSDHLEAVRLASPASKLAAVHLRGQTLLDVVDSHLTSDDLGGDFAKSLSAVRAAVSRQRLSRKVGARQLMVSNPVAALQRKKRQNERKVDNRKRQKHELIIKKKGAASTGMMLERSKFNNL